VANDIYFVRVVEGSRGCDEAGGAAAVGRSQSQKTLRPTESSSDHMGVRNKTDPTIEYYACLPRLTLSTVTVSIV